MSRVLVHVLLVWAGGITASRGVMWFAARKFYRSWSSNKKSGYNFRKYRQLGNIETILNRGGEAGETPGRFSIKRLDEVDNLVGLHPGKGLNLAVGPADLDSGVGSLPQAKVEAGIVAGQIAASTLAFFDLPDSSSS